MDLLIDGHIISTNPQHILPHNTELVHYKGINCAELIDGFDVIFHLYVTLVTDLNGVDQASQTQHKEHENIDRVVQVTQHVTHVTSVEKEILSFQ